MTYSGWLRASFPTGAVEGDTYKCLSTKEVFIYHGGKWHPIEDPAKTAKTLTIQAPAKDEKPKAVKRSRKKKAE